MPSLFRLRSASVVSVIMNTSMPWSNVEVKSSHVWSGKSFASAIRGDQQQQQQQHQSADENNKSRNAASMSNSMPMPKFAQKFGTPTSGDITAHVCRDD